MGCVLVFFPSLCMYKKPNSRGLLPLALLGGLCLVSSRRVAVSSLALRSRCRRFYFASALKRSASLSLPFAPSPSVSPFGSFGLFLASPLGHLTMAVQFSVCRPRPPLLRLFRAKQVYMYMNLRPRWITASRAVPLALALALPQPLPFRLCYTPYRRLGSAMLSRQSTILSCMHV